MQRATIHLHAPLPVSPADHIALDYDDRFLRRKALRSDHGLDFVVDLPKTVALAHGDALQLEDGRLVQIIAAPEPVLLIRGDLPRLAWHIGNRHTPCQIEADHLVIRADHVLRAMLEGLGADVTETSAPFTPEGGAYGAAQVMGHSHGPHDHEHGHHHHYD